MNEMTRGDSRTLSTTVYTDSSKTVAKNLSLVTGARFTIRKSARSPVIATLTLADGDIAITNAGSGLMEIYLLPEHTASLPSSPTVVEYDIELTWTGGQVTTVEHGKINVIPDLSV